MTPPPNPFKSLVDKIKNVTAQNTTFIGVYVNKKGHIKIIRDAAGKLAWYDTAALLYKEFIKRSISDPKEFANCKLYAVNSRNYINNKLVINLYESAKVKVNEAMLMPINALELHFHKRTSLAIFMPLQINLDNLFNGMKNDPSKMFEAAARAKDLIFNESKACSSCGTLCHVPDMEEQPGITDKQLKEIINVTADGRYFCFDCGRNFITSAAEYKLNGCTDFNKIKTVNSLISQINGLAFTDPEIDFDKAKNLMKDIVSHVSDKKLNMTAVSGSTITSQTTEKPAAGHNVTPPSNTSPWLN